MATDNKSTTTSSKPTGSTTNTDTQPTENAGGKTGRYDTCHGACHNQD